MADSAISHLDHQVIARDGHNLSTFDLCYDVAFPIAVVVFVSTCALRVSVEARQIVAVASANHVRFQPNIFIAIFRFPFR